MFGEINFGFFGPLHFQFHEKLNSKVFSSKAVNLFVEELVKHKARIVSDFIHSDFCSGSVNVRKDFNPFLFSHNLSFSISCQEARVFTTFASS